MIDRKRARAQSYDPRDLVIFGFDIPATPEHPLVDKDFARLAKINDALVRNMDVLGVILPVVVVSVVLPAEPPPEYAELQKTPEWQALAARGAVWPCRLWGERVAALVDGRRRTLHARLANKARFDRGEEPWLIRSVARRGNEHDETHRDAGIAANRFRESHSAIAEAEQIVSRRNAGADWKHCEDVFGLSRSSMENRIALLELAPGVQAAIRAGQLGLSGGLELRNLGLGLEQQEQLLEAALAEGGPKRGLVPRIRTLAVDLGLLASPIVQPDAWPDDVRDRHGNVLERDQVVLVRDFGRRPTPFRARVHSVVERRANGYVLNVETEAGVLEPSPATITVHTADVEGTAPGASVEVGPAVDDKPRAGLAEAIFEADAESEWPEGVQDRDGRPIEFGGWVLVEDPEVKTPYRGRAIRAAAESSSSTMLPTTHLLTVFTEARRQMMASSSVCKAIAGPSVSPDKLQLAEPTTRAPAGLTVAPETSRRPSYDQLEALLKHRDARKALTAGEQVTLLWVLGKGGPSHHCLNALRILDEGKAKAATGGKAAKHAPQRKKSSAKSSRAAKGAAAS